MNQVDITVQIDLSKILEDSNYSDRLIDRSIQASMFVFENAYVDEAPRDEGKYVQGIETKKQAFIDYVVRSTARNRGANYPLFLFMGTGKMYGKPDFGYTSGRVRAGDVAYGIGGIRPNKVALRAKERAESTFFDKLNQFINTDLNK